MLLGPDVRDARANLLHPFEKFPAQPAVDVLSGQGRDEPRGTLKQVSVGELHTGLLLARHGVSGEKALGCGLAEDLLRARDDFALGAADIGEQSLGRECRTQALNQVDNGDDRRRENHHRAALHGVGGVGDGGVDRALLVSTLQHRRAVAPDNAAAKLPLLQREPQRAADEPVANDGDLPNRH